MIKIQEKINKKYPNEKLKVLDYSGCKNPLSIKCENCSTVYNFTVAENSYRREKNCLCKKCYNKTKISKSGPVQNILKNIEEIKQKYTIIEMDLSNVKNTVTVKCKKCEYLRKTTIESFSIAFKKCPKCETKNVLLTKEEVNKQLEEITQNKIQLIGEYSGNCETTLFKCNYCDFIWKTKVGNIKSGTRCPKCNQKESKGENKIKEWLLKNNINFFQEYSIKSNFHDYHRQRFDFYIPLKKLAIEFNGIQHYEPVEKFGGEEEFEKTKLRDLKKSTYCKNNNIKLLIISYKDFKNINKILSSTFND